MTLFLKNQIKPLYHSFRFFPGLILCVFSFFIIPPPPVQSQQNSCGFETKPSINELYYGKIPTYSVIFRDLSQIINERDKYHSDYSNDKLFILFTHPHGNIQNMACNIPGNFNRKFLFNISDLNTYTQNGVEFPISFGDPCYYDFFDAGNHTVKLIYEYKNRNGSTLEKQFCTNTYRIKEITEVSPGEKDATIEIVSDNGKQDITSKFTIKISDIKIPKPWENYNGNVMHVKHKDPSGVVKPLTAFNLSVATFPVEYTLEKLDPGKHTLILFLGDREIKTRTFEVKPRQDNVVIPPQCQTKCLLVDIENGTSTYACTNTTNKCEYCPNCGKWGYAPPTDDPINEIPALQKLCERIGQSNENSPCKLCVNTGGIWTAIGCIPTDLGAVINEYVFPIGLGFAGTIAFLFFIWGCFLVLTSAGNPEQIAQAKEIILSAISGLLLIIFSVFLLRIIGVDILKIPGIS